MKRPVTLSIDRLVLPAAFKGQEVAYERALSSALQARATGGQGGDGTQGDAVTRSATATARAIGDKAMSGDNDG